MGRIKTGFAVAVTALFINGAPAFAGSLTDPGVPHTINLQSMVFDAEGKVTKSEFVDMTIRILDADNNVLFSEEQNDIVVVKGAINVNIGESSGGVPLDILDPSTGMKLIDVEIAGQSPFELMPLGALPYAMWAEKSLTVANDSIGTEQIKNGSIKAEDIDPLDFSAIQGIAGEGQIPTSMATDAELTAIIDSTTAHPASAIVVSGSFVTFVATNVQEALQKLDAKLVDEIVNRQNMMINSAHIVDGTIVNADVSPTAAIATSKLSGLVTSIAGNGLGALATLNEVSGGPGGTITDGTITGADIRDGAIPTSKLSDNSGNPLPDFAGWDQNASDDVTTTTDFTGDVSGKYNNLQLGAGVVGTTELADNAVTSAKIVANAVGNSKLADNAVTSSKILDNSIMGSDIAAGAVGSSEIAAGAVGSTEIAAGAVTGSKIAAGAMATLIRSASITVNNDSRTPDTATNCSFSSDTWWCDVSIACASGEIRTGCGGYYGALCEGSAGCGFIGTYPAPSNACTAKIGQDRGELFTLTVYAICLYFN